MIRTKNITFNDILFYNLAEPNLAEFLCKRTLKLLEMIKLPKLTPINIVENITNIGLDPTSNIDFEDDTQKVNTLESNSSQLIKPIKKIYTPTTSIFNQLRTPKPTLNPSTNFTNLPTTEDATLRDTNLPTTVRGPITDFNT